MRRADRWMRKFQPDGPFVSARDGLVLNGIAYVLGEPVDLTGLGPRRRRILYDAGRIMYPPQGAALPELVEPEPPPDESTEGDDELGEEFEELFEEEAPEEADAPVKPKTPRAKTKRVPPKKK